MPNPSHHASDTRKGHTPGHDEGPWYVVLYGDGDSLVICRDEAGDQRIAFMATPGCRDLRERQKVWKRIKANTRLIAEAPAMLEALRVDVSHMLDAVLSLEAGQNKRTATKLLDERIAQVEALLARIDGGRHG